MWLKITLQGGCGGIRVRAGLHAFFANLHCATISMKYNNTVHCYCAFELDIVFNCQLEIVWHFADNLK